MSNSQLYQNKIIAKKSSIHGYGVFANKRIKKGELIETCYFFIGKGNDHGLEDIYFDAGKRRYAVFTGFGSIYNHQNDHNADYRINITKKIATIKAIRDIAKGEEIYISYGDAWFKTRDIKPKAKK